MIFHNQETAEFIRNQATEQLEKFIADIVLQLKQYPTDLESLSENGINEFVKMEIREKMPNLVNTLLYKSGIIFPSDGHGVNPVILFYDSDHDYIISQAMQLEYNGLCGGLYNGRIHT